MVRASGLKNYYSVNLQVLSVDGPDKRIALCVLCIANFVVSWCRVTKAELPFGCVCWTQQSVLSVRTWLLTQKTSRAEIR